MPVLPVLPMLLLAIGEPDHTSSRIENGVTV